MTSRREEKRKIQRDVNYIIENAKQDMADWVLKFPYDITEREAAAWQAGYIAGLNRVRNEVSR
jgi:hypothetical protein